MASGKSSRKRSSTTQGQSQRQLRVGEEMRHVLARIFDRGELRDPALQDASPTVTEVRIAPDLKHATVFVMPLGGKNAPEVVAALRRASGYLRMAMAREIDLRVAPMLGFELDASFEYASKIDALLHREEVQRDLAAPVPESDDTDPDGTAPDGKDIGA
jgi:ribosome-binding factor A